MSSEIAIKVKDLGKCYQIYEKPRDRLMQMLARGKRQYYREFWALKDISFEIKKGETVGIIGRNGSGKSTLLQLICGTLNPTSGEIQISGRVAALLELGAGFNPEFTGRENVYMAASLYGLIEEDVNNRMAAIESFADIGEFIEQPVKTYSSGMFVRLAFSVIAHVDADILVIDEALSVGDAFFTQKCMRFLRKFMETGTVLFVSHDTGSVINLCKYSIWLDKGAVKFQGDPKDAARLYLAELYESVHDDGEPVQSKSEEEDKVTAYRDMRIDMINATNLRNDIEVFAFRQDSQSFGKRGGRIVSVSLVDDSGAPFSWVVGGEMVRLRVRCLAESNIVSPIIGFFVNDRLGQNLFGDNTFNFSKQNPLIVAEGQFIDADFVFRMPILPIGDYTITVALAEGTQQDHIQHHWMHEALIIKSHSTSVSTGLVGVPMSDIRLGISNA